MSYLMCRESITRYLLVVTNDAICPTLATLRHVLDKMQGAAGTDPQVTRAAFQQLKLRMQTPGLTVPALLRAHLLRRALQTAAAWPRLLNNIVKLVVLRNSKNPLVASQDMPRLLAEAWHNLDDSGREAVRKAFQDNDMTGAMLPPTGYCICELSRFKAMWS